MLSNLIDPKRGDLTIGTVSDTTVGLLVQDAWTVHRRLTVNLGLRTENETVPFYTPVGPSGEVPPIHFSALDKLAPRAGAAWDVTGDGRWKVHGSWGVFYDIIKLSMPQLAFGGVQFSLYSFKLETYDWPSLVSSPGCPPACPGGTARPTVGFDTSFENIDPDLAPMRMQEATLGLEHQMSPHLAVFLGGQKRVTLGLNVLNLFNQAQGVSRYSLENDQGVQLVIDEASYFAGRADVGAAFDQQHAPRDPRFLQYDGFQEPIRARVMVRFSF